MEHILNFYRYNSDVRKKYLAAIERLPWEEVVKDHGASFRSIRNGFVHVLNAYRYWFQYAVKDNCSIHYDVSRRSLKYASAGYR